MMITYAEICNNIPLDIEEMKETIKILYKVLDDKELEKEWLAESLAKIHKTKLQSSRTDKQYASYWIELSEKHAKPTSF